MEEKQLRELIAINRLDIFYKSKTWQRTARLARRQQHNECQRCKAKGYYSPCEIVHHRKHLKDRPDLALDLENLECLCMDCHNREHLGIGRGDGVAAGYQNEERW